MIGQRSHYILLQPGDFVRLQGHDDWGHGQVQSAIGNKITVNFDHAGKQMINSDHAVLIPVKLDDLPNRDQS
jgi:hypothetical protein